MRLLLLPLLTLAACADDSIDNTSYRRVVDAFDSSDQCVADGNFARCYDTLTFCADGTVNAVLDFREEGHYKVDGDVATARLPTVTVIFDLGAATSAQLPGRHAWEPVEPLFYDCAPH